MQLVLLAEKFFRGFAHRSEARQIELQENGLPAGSGLKISNGRLRFGPTPRGEVDFRVMFQQGLIYSSVKSVDRMYSTYFDGLLADTSVSASIRRSVVARWLKHVERTSNNHNAPR